MYFEVKILLGSAPWKQPLFQHSKVKQIQRNALKIVEDLAEETLTVFVRSPSSTESQTKSSGLPPLLKTSRCLKHWNRPRTYAPTFIHDLVHLATRTEHSHAQLVDHQDFPAWTFLFDETDYIVQDFLAHNLFQSHDVSFEWWRQIKVIQRGRFKPSMQSSRVFFFLSKKLQFVCTQVRVRFRDSSPPGPEWMWRGDIKMIINHAIDWTYTFFVRTPFFRRSLDVLIFLAI